MKKRLLTLTACMMTASFVLTGCSLFSNSDKDTQAAAGTSEGGIAITDSYTHEDPTDFEWDERVAYTSGRDNQEYVDSYKEYYGVDYVTEYVIIYGNGGNVVNQYEYYVFKTEDDAKVFNDAMAAMGNTLQSQTGNVVCIPYDVDTFNDYIDMQMQMSGLGSRSMSDYSQFIKEGWGYIAVQ